jgi:hypothetical protein
MLAKVKYLTQRAKKNYYPILKLHSPAPFRTGMAVAGPVVANLPATALLPNYP